MGRKIVSCLCALFILLGALSVPSFAVGDNVHSYGPIFLGAADVDYMADEILKEIPTSGKTDREKIAAVYDWIEENCIRDGWDGTLWFDEGSVVAAQSAYRSYMEGEVGAGRASYRKTFREDTFTGSSGMTFLSYDSNAYIESFARSMFYRRCGNCAHFSALLTVLVNHLGYDCRLIDGSFVNRDGSSYEHKWNCVLIDGQYYWLDSRIDQSNYERTGAHSYVYFLESSTDVWAERHNWDHGYSDWLFANAQQIAGETMIGAPWSASSAWAETYLKDAAENGLLPAVLRGLDMTAPITRAEFAAAAVLLYEALGGNTAGQPEEDPFRDTDDGMVLKAYALGVVQGVGDGEFAPNSTLTREQAATMLGRVYELCEYGSVGTGEALGTDGPDFADASQISSYAAPYIGFFAEHRILEGVGNGNFSPKGTMTREQALKVAVVCLQELG